LASYQHDLWMSVINLGEVYYRVAREQHFLAAERVLIWLEARSLRFAMPDRTLTLEAAKIKSRYPLSYADCFAAALAQQLDASVVTGDPEFRPLERAGMITVEWLPLRAKHRR
jgi:predicted nucleic acid-binding protein